MASRVTSHFYHVGQGSSPCEFVRRRAADGVSSAAMPRRFSALLALVPVFAACGSNPSSSLMCPTKAQSLTFSAAGGCGGAGTGSITISTQPGLCSLLVKGGSAVGLPNQGNFTGDAMGTTYELTQDKWQLQVDQGNSQDGSLDVQCDIAAISAAGELTLSCMGSQCQPDDCSGAGGCTPIDCVEHLTPM